MRIHQLPSAIANQIAAGEVIERPASVVKELLENSLDAGATSISIEIGYGGLNQIKISDNGTGIVAEDLPLAIAAHATSKITRLDDLYAIDSMGFRGEALASIASVAKITISSKPAAQEHAMMLRMQGADYTISPCARSNGTSIDVVDIFFNAPVRKRFLKSEKLEFQAIETVVKRFALSAPEVAITLKHNGKEVFTLPPAHGERGQLMRVSKIFGSSFMRDAIFLEAEAGDMRLSGWLSGPDFQRSQNDRQWVYINQRMVKDKLINHALKQAYDGLLHPGRFPACLLYFTINTAEVDVNVHPTKHEVRFQQPRLVHDFFTSHMQRALTAKVSKNDTQEYELAEDHSLSSGKDLCEPFSYLNYLDTHATNEHPVHASLQNKAHSSVAAIKNHPEYEYNSYSARDTRLCGEERKALWTADSGYNPDVDMPWVILNKQYFLVFIKQTPFFVDALGLQQRRIQRQLEQQALPLASRPLLVPVNYFMPGQLTFKPDELKACLGQLGLNIEYTKTDQFMVRSIPIIVPYLDLHLFLESVFRLEHLQMNQLIELLSQAQLIEPRLFSSEERSVLNQLLLESLTDEMKYRGLLKALTIDDCRVLLHV